MYCNKSFSMIVFYIHLSRVDMNCIYLYCLWRVINMTSDNDRIFKFCLHFETSWSHAIHLGILTSSCLPSVFKCWWSGILSYLWRSVPSCIVEASGNKASRVGQITIPAELLYCWSYLFAMGILFLYSNMAIQIRWLSFKKRVN